MTREWYELRDPDGNLKARGDKDFCYRRLNECQPLMAESALQTGWTILPVAMDCITGSNVI